MQDLKFVLHFVNRCQNTVDLTSYTTWVIKRGKSINCFFPLIIKARILI